MVEIKNELDESTYELTLLKPLIDFCHKNTKSTGDFMDNFSLHITSN